MAWTDKGIEGGADTARDARIRDLAYPAEDRVTNELGDIICLKFVNKDRVRASCGHDVGWMKPGQADGEFVYAAAEFVCGEDGVWTVDPQRATVRNVVSGSVADSIAPEYLWRPAFASLERALRQWVVDRADIVARARLCDTKTELFRIEEEIEGLEARLEQLRGRMPSLRHRVRTQEAAVAEAEAEVAARNPGPKR